MNISMVPKEALTSFWPKVEPFLSRSIKRSGGRYDIASVYLDLATGTQTLWIAFEEKEVKGCWTLRINEYPAMRVCALEWVGGVEIDSWVYDGVKMIKAYAKDMECQKVEALGRPGWQKFLDKIGWAKVAIQYECELKE